MRWMLSLVLLSSAVVNVQAQQRIRVLIVSGANNHDWAWTTPSFAEMLAATGKFEIDVTYEPAKGLADAAKLAKYGAILLDYNGPRWGEPAETNFLEAVRGGVGVAVVHAADNAFGDWPEYTQLVGDCWVKGTTAHGKFHAFDIELVESLHPIVAGMPTITAHPDELYHDLVRTPGTSYTVLASAMSSKESGGTGEREPMVLVGAFGKGRVFHTPLGHVWPGTPANHVSHRDPQFQRLIARGVEWAATGNVAPEAPWRTLFDGQDVSQWRGFKQAAMPAKGWNVRDGALVCEKAGGGGDLVTKAAFGDFALAFEFRVTPKANSGVMYRVAEDQDQTYLTGPEYQVLADDYFEAGKLDPMHSAGALYAITPANGAVLLPNGEFNRGLILVRGWNVEHWVNGVLVAQCDLAGADGKQRIAASKFAAMPAFATHGRGLIALQDHGDEVAYRNIRVRELGSAAASKSLFNGRNLDGWTHFLADGGKRDDVWQAVDGVLVCKGKPAGYICTQADYTNYVLELDWRWPGAAGNSGVLLRKIGDDKIWPKSLEAQLQSENAGDFWKIEEFPSTTDASRTNGRNCKKTHGNEKPLGEWNHYKISVDHGTVTLEVNGQVLNQATDVLETAGKICLQSEGAEIHFRDIRITPVP